MGQYWTKKVAPCEFDLASISSLNEEWQPVVGWERFYRVSSLGRVLSLHQTGRLVTGMLVRGGYRVLKLRDGARQANAMVHRLVLEAFEGPCPDGYEACHCNGVPDDNRASNLRWDSKKANAADRVAHGTMATNTQSRLTEEWVRQIRSMPSIPDSHWAARLGVTPTSILLARTGQTWAHVNTAPLMKGKRKRMNILAIAEAAEKYGIDVKRLRGYIWRNDLMDPIGCLETDQVYEDWRLQKLFSLPIAA